MDSGGVLGFVGNVTGSVASDPTGSADPTMLGGGLALGTGNGSTAGINDFRAPFGIGGFVSNDPFGVPGTSDQGGQTVTLMVVAFSGTTYDDSLYRGHSAAFTLVTSARTAESPTPVGSAMQAFSIFGPIPEPSMLSLCGVGMGAFVLIRRRK